MAEMTQREYVRKRQEEAGVYSKAIPELFDMAVSYIARGEEAARQGKKVVWSSGLWEAPIIYACDTMPVAFTELGRLANPDSMLIAEDYFQVPRDICTMVNVLLGEWFLRRDGDIKRLLGFNGSCESFNLAWELLKQEGYDVKRIESAYITPGMSKEEFDRRAAFLTEQLYDAARWLNHGAELDEDKLRFEIVRKNRIFKKIQYILEKRLENPLFLKSLDTMYLITGGSHCFGDPERFEGILDRLIEELDADLYHPDASGIIPLVWSGSRGQEFGVYQALDELGAAVLGWVIPAPFSRLYEEDVPPVEAVARFVMQASETSGSIVSFTEAAKAQLDKVHAKGVLLYNYVGCSLGGVSLEYERNYFHDRNIPCLSVDGNFQVGAPSGQLITRVRAFIEMLS